MSYIYFFLIIFIPLYALLVEKDDFFKLNIKIIIAGLVSVSSLLVYENILSDGSLELAYLNQSLDIFLGEDQLEKENKTNYIHPENLIDMNTPDKKGNTRHWILEIHFVDRDRQIGGFFEQLLIPVS